MGINLEKKKKEKNSKKSADVGKKMAASTKICALRRAGFLNNRLSDLAQILPDVPKYLVLWFELGYFILKQNCLQN